MSLRKGNDVSLQIQQSTGQFVNVGGVVTRTMSVDRSVVQVDDAQSGPWQRLGAGGRASVVFTGDGLFLDNAVSSLVQQAAFAGSVESWRLHHGDGTSFDGDFVVAKLMLGGKNNSQLEFSIELQSAGPVVFRPAN